MVKTIEQLKIKGKLIDSFHHEDVQYDVDTPYTLAHPGMCIDEICFSDLRVHLYIKGILLGIDSLFIYTYEESEEIKANLDYYNKILRPHLLGLQYGI